MSLSDWSLGLRISKEKKRNEPENVFLNTKGAKKKIISVQMKSVREKESVNVGRSRECRGEEIIRERELDGEQKRKRETEESKDLACNNVPGKSIPVKLANQEGAESRRRVFRFLDQVAEKLKRNLYARREELGEFYRNFFRPRDFQEYISTPAQFTATYAGTMFVYFVM